MSHMQCRGAPPGRQHGADGLPGLSLLHLQELHGTSQRGVLAQQVGVGVPQLLRVLLGIVILSHTERSICFKSCMNNQRLRDFWSEVRTI